MTSVTDVMSLTKEDIESDFPGGDGMTTCLHFMDCRKLLEVQDWFMRKMKILLQMCGLC